MTPGSLFAGTSGFDYPSWKPGFYPATLPRTKFLTHYASRLNLVESNFTFRQFLRPAIAEKWIANTPQHFQFAAKANQRITHFARLKDADEITQRFLDSLELLRSAGRLAPILFQLPPNFACDAARLGAFLDGLPRTHRYAFEFRHDSWFVNDVFAVLRLHQAALCLAESEKLVAPEVITADFIYLRLRKNELSEAEEAAVLSRVRRFLATGRSVFALFKHEEDPAGALRAERLLAGLS